MTLRAMLLNVLIALVIAVPLGGYFFGLTHVDGGPLGARLQWGLVGLVAIIADIDVHGPKLLEGGQETWCFVAAFIVALVGILAVRFIRASSLPHKMLALTTTAVSTIIALVFVLVPEPADIVSSKIPPDFRNGASITIPFEVREHRIYYIDLDFHSKDAADREKTKALVGEAYTGCVQETACGIVTQIKLEIQNSKGDILPIPMKTLFGPQGHYAFTLDSLYMRNLATLPLKPGRYKLVATALDVDEKIHSQHVEMTVRFDARARPLRAAAEVGISGLMPNGSVNV